ncbi:MAG: ABC transporter substrate-binding protein [Pseudobdellovibrionaceae bacterium]
MKRFLLPILFLFPSLVFAQALKLALNWKPEPQFGGFYAAADLFKKQGLDVQILEGGSGTPTIQMLASKQVDLAVVSGDEIILAHDRGATDVVAIYATYQTAPTGIMTRGERNLKSLEEVFQSEGTLLWQTGLPYAQYLQKKYGPFKVKTAPYPGGIGNFQNDVKISQQCFVTSEPLLAQKAGVKEKTFLVSDSGFNPYVTVLAVRSSALKENPEKFKKLVEALRQGWAQYLKDPKPTNQAMAKINRAMDMETFQKSAEVQKSLIQTKKAPLGSMTEERWKTLVDQLTEIKLIKNKIKASDLFQNL